MCNQTVSLISAEVERNGICTVVIQLLREPAVKVRPPRALLVPFRHGYPLDAPEAPDRQHQVIEACLQMLESAALTAPALREYKASY